MERNQAEWCKTHGCKEGDVLHVKGGSRDGLLFRITAIGVGMVVGYELGSGPEREQVLNVPTDDLSMVESMFKSDTVCDVAGYTFSDRDGDKCFLAAGDDYLSLGMVGHCMRLEQEHLDELIPVLNLWDRTGRLEVP
jgi:hypothetical protein